MPDAFSHIALPSLFHRWVRRPIMLPLFLIGTVLPDYLRQGTALFLSSHHHPAVGIYHTLIGAFLTSLFLTSFFLRSQRKWVFLSFFIGQLVHFAVDYPFDNVVRFSALLCLSPVYLLFLFYQILWKILSIDG